MDKQKSLDYFMKLNYSPILKKIGNRYYLFIPELSLITEEDDLKVAYEKLEEEKARYFKRAIDLGIQDTVKEPISVAATKRVISGLFAFFMKTLIVSLVCITIFIGSLSIISGFMNRIVDQGLTRTKNIVIERLARVYYKLDDMSEREKENLRLRLKKAVENIKPYTDEIKVLWKDETKEK